MLENYPAKAKFAASYSRYSSDLQDNSSLEQQKKKCREQALNLNLSLPVEFEFSDEGISGIDPNRPGLLELIRQAKAGKFQVLILDSLSRFSRELSYTIATIKDLALNYSVRVISTSEGLDTNNPNWEIMFAFMGYGNQQFIRNLRHAVRRGQEDAHRKGFSTGGHPFGYTTVDVPGSEYGRKKKLRKKVVIHEDHAAWVRKIFDMFVHQKISISKIARELTQFNAPKDHRSTVNQWNHQSVLYLLHNPRYVGIWGWGKKTNVLNELTGKKRQKARPEKEFQDTLHFMEELRIIDDSTFLTAQGMLEKNKEKYIGSRSTKGRFCKATNDMQDPRHALQGLFRCNHCESRFVTHGEHYMQCSGHIKGNCSVASVLPRKLAEELLLRTFIEKVLDNQPLSDCMFETFLKAHEKAISENPADLEALRANYEKLEKNIKNLVQLCADGDMDIPEVSKKIQELSQQKKIQEQNLLSFEANRKNQTEKPSKESMLRQIQLLGGKNEKTSKLPAFHARNLFGEIRLLEVETPGRKRKHFLGVGTLSTQRLSKMISGHQVLTEDSCDEDIMLEFIPPPEWMEHVPEIMRLYAEGVKDRDIAKHLGIPRCWIAPARKHDAEVSGKEFMDGRKLKARLERETFAKKYADQVKEMLDQGMLLQDIAKALDLDRNVITWAKDHWFKSRGLTPPDGRIRRKSLERKCSDPSKKKEAGE